MPGRTWSEVARRSAPPIMVGGFGLPWQRDLDFGSRFVCAVEDLDWPEAVVVEDLSHSALLVLDRLQELRPSKLVLVTCRPRGDDVPGTLRRYILDAEPPSPEEVHEQLAGAVGGAIDLEQTLAIARYWNALPPRSVLLELEPWDTSLGLGLSMEVMSCIDRVLDAVRDELGVAGALTGSGLSDEGIHDLLASPGTAR